MLSAKAVKCRIKNGATSAEMMQKYGFETEEELFVALKRIFKFNSATVISDLQRNDKRASSRQPRVSTSIEIQKTDVSVMVKECITTQSSIISENTEGISCTHDTVSEDFETALPSEPTAIVPPIEIPCKLEELIRDESELSKTLMQLETKHKTIVSKRLSCVKSLTACKKTCEELQRLISENKKRLTDVITEYTDLAGQMKNLTDEISVTRSILAETREQIASLRKVEIYVYANSTIDVEHADSFTFDETTIDISELIQQPDAEELTIKELKNVAKLLKMVQSFNSEGIQYELSFENQKVQDFFETIINANT